MPTGVYIRKPKTHNPNPNKMWVIDDVGYIELLRKNNSPLVTLVDAADMEKITIFPYRWTPKIDRTGTKSYAHATFQRNGVATSVTLHKFLIGASSDGMLIDHKDGDGLNNRRNNLRIVTPIQNAENRRTANRNNILGVRNVRLEPDGKYGVLVRHIYIGRYNSLEEAEQVAIDARKRLMTHAEA